MVLSSFEEKLINLRYISLFKTDVLCFFSVEKCNHISSKLIFFHPTIHPFSIPNNPMQSRGSQPMPQAMGTRQMAMGLAPKSLSGIYTFLPV